MPHLTEIRESADEVYGLAPNAEGFWTKPMADCALVVVLWEAHGANYAHGWGQHCSGGLGAQKLDKLTRGVPANDAIVILVWGTTDHGDSFSDKQAQGELETVCRNNNWTLRTHDAVVSDSVVTRAGDFYPTMAGYEARDQPAPNLNKGRCCVIT
jgi:hypothetical protein